MQVEKYEFNNYFVDTHGSLFIYGYGKTVKESFKMD